MVILRKPDLTNYVSEIDFTTYSGTLQSQIDSKLFISDFTTYSGMIHNKLTQLELDITAYTIVLG